MKEKCIEFECKDKEEIKKVFIKDMSIYNGITYEHDTYWNKERYVVKLYYYKCVKEEGRIYVEKDYDAFNYSNEDEAIKLYEKLKDRLKEEI